MWGWFLSSNEYLNHIDDEYTPRCINDQKKRLLYRRAQVWTVFKSWRYAILVKKEKKDRHRFTCKEKDILYMYEHSLLLHDILVTTSKEINDHRIDFIQFIYREQLDGYGECEKLVDRQERTILHHAVLNEWNIDDISWITGIYPKAAGIQDCDGFSPLTYATLNGLRDEIILQLAVPTAQDVLDRARDMIQTENFEGCRRLFVQTSNKYFAGVPHFDQGLSAEVDGFPVESAVQRMMDMWVEFISVWGHFDQPSIRTDLPPKFRVTLGSRVLYTIEAKGEPLTYQWFRNNEELEGCTSATLDVTSSAQPHDEGCYFCRLSNWKGSTDSNISQLIVLDDTLVIDPSTRYIYNFPLKTHETLFKVKANVGRFIDVGGIQIFIPPHSFEIIDHFDVDLGSSLGMDLVIGVDQYPEQSKLPEFGSDSTWIVSPLVSLAPTAIDELLLPWTCRIPHSLSKLNVPTIQIEVMELIVYDADGNREFRQVPKEQYRLNEFYIDLDLVHLGTFMIVQTIDLTAGSIDSLHWSERMCLMIFGPKRILAGTNETRLYLYSCPMRRGCPNLIQNEVEDEKSELSLLTTRLVHVPYSTKSIEFNVDGTPRSYTFETSKSMYIGKIDVSLGNHLQWTKNGIGFTSLQLQIGVNDVSLTIDIFFPLYCQECLPVVGLQLLTHTTQGIEIAWTHKATDFQLPNYFVVEMAIFSKTFWDRYKDIWWFDRGNLSIVHRMYRIVHCGMQSQIKISTDVHAASIRISSCNGDTFGTYCKNLLVSPDTIQHEEINASTEARDIILGASDDLILNRSRLNDLIERMYTTKSFVQIYGFTLNISALLELLEARKREYRSSHYTIVLLLLGYDSLARTAKNALFHQDLCRSFAQALAFSSRFVHAFDASIKNDSSIIDALHLALQDTFTLVYECTGPGWFSRYLDSNAANMLTSFSKIFDTLVTKCLSHAHFSNVGMRSLLNEWEMQSSQFTATNPIYVDELKQLHACSLLHVTNQDPKIVLDYFTNAFQTDMIVELNPHAISKVLAIVQERNTLQSHIRLLQPAPNELTPHTPHVIVQMDGTVIGIDPLRFISVKNMQLKVRVNGEVSFCKNTRTATFIPTVPFEVRTNFKVKLRADAITTWYGTSSSTMKYNFITKPK